MISSVLTISIVVIVLTCLILNWYKSRHVRASLPPGPTRLPFLGNLLQMLPHPHNKFHNWALTHGKYYTIFLGKTPALIVNDSTTMKEIFSQKVATDKPSFFLFDLVFDGSYGIINANGDAWVELRNFSAKAMKQFGVTKGSKVLQSIVAENQYLHLSLNQAIKENNGLIKLHKILLQLVGNAIWGLVAGEITETPESKPVFLVEQLVKNIQVATRSGLAFLPWLRHIIPERSGFTGHQNICDEIHGYIEDIFRKREEKRNAIPQDFIDVFIRENEKCQDGNSAFYGKIGRKHSVNSIKGIMFAGAEPTASVINFMIFYFLVHPNVQKKLQEEIDRVIGIEGYPEEGQREKMPYTEAVILETLRVSSVIPFGIIHKLMENLSYDGYLLPKGMFLFSNIYFVHNDPNIWGDPENFRPERFVECGKEEYLRLKSNVVSFQPGRRSCIGEQVARDLLFLICVTLFQKYNFKPEPGRNVKEYLEPNTGFALLPKHLDVIVEHRNK